MHVDHGEQRCDPCLEANREYHRLYHLTRRARVAKQGQRSLGRRITHGPKGRVYQTWMAHRPLPRFPKGSGGRAFMDTTPDLVAHAMRGLLGHDCDMRRCLHMTPGERAALDGWWAQHDPVPKLLAGAEPGSEFVEKLMGSRKGSR